MRTPFWRLLFAAALAGLAPATSFAGDDLASYVDPFIGTAPANPTAGFKSATGDVFPGAVAPRGMLQWSPDTPSDLPGGYFYPDHVIKGFSLRHFSGRGCDAWQDFAFMPLRDRIEEAPSAENGFFGAPFSHDNESAEPGYYRVRLDNGISVELTAGVRTGIARFQFPSSGDPILAVNAGSSITGTTADTSIEVVGAYELRGKATAKVGCGKELYTLYFVARFQKAFSSFGTWSNGPVMPDARQGKGAHSGALVTFDASGVNSVLVKTGISFVSIENAAANLDAEIPGWDFAAVRSQTREAWNQSLASIRVSGGTEGERKAFYTSLYHCYLHPNVFNDANGEYLGMDGKVHTVEPGRTQYENITGWDSYRSEAPLMAILEPKQTADIVASLLNDARQGGGGIPRWEQANRNSGGMVGDGGTILVAAAKAFGVSDFDTSAALKAMELNADHPGAVSDSHPVRQGLAEYLSRGYVPGQASVTLEYTSADFALSRFAADLGNAQLADTYLRRSGNWKNLFNAKNGLIQPKALNGDWAPNVGEATRKGYTEGSAAEYTWMVPYDLSGLIQELGGNDKAVARLDHYFTKLNEANKGDGRYAFMGNEPCEGDPWVYDYAEAPAKAQAVIRRIENELFTDRPDGLPGNDDAGATSSWYVFAALGLYPNVPGVGGFVVGSPLFDRAVVRVNSAHELVIVGRGASTENPFVQDLAIDGRPTSSLWIPFDRVKSGARVEFSLGPKESEWGKAPADAPPSYSAPSLGGGSAQEARLLLY